MNSWEDDPRLRKVLAEGSTEYGFELEFQPPNEYTLYRKGRKVWASRGAFAIRCALAALDAYTDKRAGGKGGAR